MDACICTYGPACVLVLQELCVCMHRCSSHVSTHPGCSEFLVGGLSPSHLVVMETRAAAGTALAWVLYVSHIDHGMLNTAGQTIVHLSLSLSAPCQEWEVPLYVCASVLSGLPPRFIEKWKYKRFCKLCAYKFTSALLFTCIFQPFVSKIVFFNLIYSERMWSLLLHSCVPCCVLSGDTVKKCCH